MVLLIVCIVLAVILLVIGLIIGAYNLAEHNTKSGFLSLLTCPAIFLILLFGTFCKVPANSVGIIYDDRAGILNETIKEGYHGKSIFQHITTISTSNRNANITTTGQTNDGQYATFEISILYKIDADDAGRFYRETNSTKISDEALNTLVKSSLQATTIKYNIFEILSVKLDDSKKAFSDELALELCEKYHVTLVETSFDDVDAGEDVEKILQQKAEAEQKIEIAKKEAESALVKAENDVKIAEQEAITKKTLAEAEAYAVKVQGEAVAENATAYINRVNEMIDTIKEANNLTYEQATDIVLSIIFYDTWDGKLPEVLTSDSLSGMIGGLIKKTAE